MSYKVIDLFAGAGGFSCGFMKAGYDIDSAVEFDKMIAETYKFNHTDTKLYVDDIKNVADSKVFENKKVDVIIGGPPCQGFSMAGARIRKNFIEDERNYLFRYYYEIIKQVKPKCFVFENVKGITTMEGGSILNEILSLFHNKEMLGGSVYHTYTKVYKATDFGIPQTRERFIIIGVLDKEVDIENLFNETVARVKNEYSDFFDKVNVGDAISNLDNPNDLDEMKVEPHTSYQRFLSSNSKIVYNNTKPKHNKVALDRISQIKCGENWTQLKNDCIKSVHSGAYGRLKIDGVAPTITTRFDTPSGGCFIHPVENRTLTPREGARIQSFPDDYKFIGNKTSVYKQIGNAVPPKLAYFLAQLIKSILEQ